MTLLHLVKSTHKTNPHCWSVCNLWTLGFVRSDYVRKTQHVHCKDLAHSTTGVRVLRVNDTGNWALRSEYMKLQIGPAVSHLGRGNTNTLWSEQLSQVTSWICLVCSKQCLWWFPNHWTCIQIVTLLKCNEIAMQTFHIPHPYCEK